MAKTGRSFAWPQAGQQGGGIPVVPIAIALVLANVVIWGARAEGKEGISSAKLWVVTGYYHDCIISYYAILY